MSDTNSPSIAVVGSLNIDFCAKVKDLPAPGETIGASSLETFFGGKGANQAIAAARQGASVSLVGAVGKDLEATKYLDELKEEAGLDISNVNVVDMRTGSALITVEEQGENTIVVAQGANSSVTADFVLEAEADLENFSAVLAQLEVPVEAVVEAARIANGSEVPFILNPSPVSLTFPWQEIRTDYLIVNEGEAEIILEFSPFEEGEEVVRQRLHELRIETMIVTRGRNQTICYARNEETIEVETLPVLPVDSVGAGDAFAGCFAARIAEGGDIQDAICAANCAGALTTLGAGAQDPIPDRDMVDQHLDQLLATRS